MARRGRGGGPSDSLELLLDTICNVFGGMILMAILVVLMTQGSVGRLPGQASAASLAPQEDALLETVAILRSQMDGVAEEKLSTASKIASAESPYTQQLLERREQFEKAVNEAASVIAKTEKELEEQTRAATTSQAEADEGADKLEETEAAVQQMRLRLSELERQPRMKVRLPHRRGERRAIPKYYLVRDGKAYRYSEERMADWVGEAYVDGDCMAEPQLGLGTPAIKVAPIRNKGISVSESAADTAKFVETLSGASPARYYVVLWVHADSESFRTFQRLKNLICERGYIYSVASYDGESLIVVPGVPEAE